MSGTAYAFDAKSKLCELKEPCLYVVTKVPQHKTLDVAEMDAQPEAKKRYIFVLFCFV
jgi:hypothetical protein